MAHPDIDAVAKRTFYATLFACIAFALASFIFVL
jgi:hypothetical protein